MEKKILLWLDIFIILEYGQHFGNRSIFSKVRDPSQKKIFLISIFNKLIFPELFINPITAYIYINNIISLSSQQ